MDVLITTLDDSGIRVHASLRKSSENVVQLAVPVPIAAQTPVSLKLSEKITTQGEIAACERHENSYLVDVKIQLRREPRFHVNDPARVTVLNVPDYPTLDGQILNLSKSGLAVYLTSAVPTGCQVKVELADGIVLGEIRYCKKTDDEFTAGVAIETVMFASAEEKLTPAPPPVTGSVWGALKRLYKAVSHN